MQLVFIIFFKEWDELLLECKNNLNENSFPKLNIHCNFLWSMIWSINCSHINLPRVFRILGIKSNLKKWTFFISKICLKNIPVYKRAKILRRENCWFLKIAITKNINLKRQETGNNQLSQIFFKRDWWENLEALWFQFVQFHSLLVRSTAFGGEKKSACCAAVQICDCLHSTTARGESCSRHKICHSLWLFIQSRRKIAFISYIKNDPRLHLQFIIWTDRPGTAGLNKSVVATGFTHDFPVRGVFVPLSFSRRFDAWNTKSELTQRPTPDQFAFRLFRDYF